MNPSTNDIKTSSTQLLPHQAAFVEAFFNPASKRVIVLRGDVGFGKGTALLALCDRLLRERTKAKVLIIVPAQLRAEFAHRLREASIPSLEVDRYRYREMLDASVTGELWPAGSVIVMAREFARQHDIRNSLSSTRWDLLIVDEAHQFRAGMSRDLIRHVGESAERIVLSEMSGVDLPDAFSEQSATVIVWRRDQIVGVDGKPLDVTPRPALHEVRYDLALTELSLADTVSELCRVLEGGTSQQAWIARSWLRSFQSSPAALEARLAKLASVQNQAAHQDSEALLDDLEDEQSLENRLAHWLNPETAEKAAAVARRVAEAIEEQGDDSKLGALVRLWTLLEAPEPASRRICVLTDYVATLFYVAEEVEALGVHCELLHGSMNYDDREASIELFRTAGGILAATSAALSEGTALPDVTDLVLYDVPGNKSMLRQVLGRFDRFGRRTQLNIFVLLPSNDTFGTAAESMELLRQLVGPMSAEVGG